MSRWLRRVALPALSVLLVVLYALFGTGQGGRLVDGQGRRVIVADGDTLKIWGETIRLADLDAVERAQFCLDDKGASWSCGESAKAALETVVARGALQCARVGSDRYGRTIARCSVKDGDVGAAIVSGGWAVSDGDRYVVQEQAARDEKRGIWAGTFEAPAVWRERNQINPRKVDD